MGRLEALKWAAFWSLVALALGAIVICKLFRLAVNNEDDSDVHDA